MIIDEYHTRWELTQIPFDTRQREIVPIAAVLSNCAHLAIQVALMLALTFYYRLAPSWFWLWLPRCGKGFGCAFATCCRISLNKICSFLTLS